MALYPTISHNDKKAKAALTKQMRKDGVGKNGVVPLDVFDKAAAKLKAKILSTPAGQHSYNLAQIHRQTDYRGLAEFEPRKEHPNGTDS